MNLPEDMVKRAMELLDETGPWRCFHDYLLGLAALTTTFSTEMARRTERKRKTVLRVILGACGYSRWASYANNIHLRSNLQSDSPFLLATGTTSNEALHNQLRNAFRQVYKVHEPVLLMKLAVFVFSKQVAWDAGRRIPSLRQLEEHPVLARVLARPLIDEELWLDREHMAHDGRKVSKASVPSRTTHLRHVARVREWLRKKPARKARAVIKRNVFTQRRRLHLTGGGRNWGRRLP